MRTSKLLELAALLEQYAESSAGIRQLMARDLAKEVNREALAQEKKAQAEEQCERQQS